MYRDKDIEKDYEELKEKYGLPEYKGVNKELELLALDINKMGFMMNSIMRISLTRLGKMLGHLDSLLLAQPTSAYIMIIFKGLTAEHKAKIMDLYNKVVPLYQEGLLAELKSEEEMVIYFKKFWGKWMSLKNSYAEIVDLLMVIFKSQKEKERTQYTG